MISHNIRRFLALVALGCVSSCGSASSPDEHSFDHDPTLISLSRDTAMAGGSVVYFDVVGSNFFASSKVLWNATELPTIFVDATRLTALAGGSQLASPDTAEIRVSNAAVGGDTTLVLPFVVTPAPPTPIYDSFTPSPIEIWRMPDTVIVHGSGFVPASVLETDAFGGWTAIPTIWVDPNHLKVVWNIKQDSVTPRDYGTRVRSPSAGVSPKYSAQRILHIVPWILQFHRFTPDTIDVTADTMALGIVGSELSHPVTIFLHLGAYDWPLAVTNDSTATVKVPATELLDGHSYSAYLTISPGTGGPGASFYVRPRKPVLTSSTSIITVGTDTVAFKLGITGDHFTSNSVVMVNGTPRQTSFTNAIAMHARFSGADVATAQDLVVQVFTPAPGGGYSDSTTVVHVVDPLPVPVLDSIAPDTITVSGSTVNVELYGSGFDSTSVVRWGPDSVSNATGTWPTVYFSPGHVRAKVSAGPLAPPQTIYLWVRTPAPGGGDSGRRPLVVH